MIPKNRFSWEGCLSRKDRKHTLGCTFSLFSPPPPHNPSDDVTEEPPDALCCPIGLTLMEDPVILVETGHTYERQNIEAYLKRCVLCESVRGCERARRMLAL